MRPAFSASEAAFVLARDREATGRGSGHRSRDEATVVGRLMAILLSLNRIGFGLAYLLAPAPAGQGWIGRAARDPATQVFVRGHGARDLALGAGSLATLVPRQAPSARLWLAAQAVADASDVAATLLARRRIPRSGFRFALTMASVSTAVAAVAFALLARDQA
jgi:hypothetical protein